jgi:hypothetical protein
MPAVDALTWLDQERGIIHWKFDQSQTVEEVLAAFDTFRQMAESVPYRTYPILDFTEAGTIPTNILTHYPEMQRRLPVGDKRAALIAVVSQKTFINSLMNIFSRIYKDPVIFFQSFDAAYQYVLDKVGQASAPDTE